MSSVRKRLRNPAREQRGHDLRRDDSLSDPASGEEVTFSNPSLEKNLLSIQEYPSFITVLQASAREEGCDGDK